MCFNLQVNDMCMAGGVLYVFVLMMYLQVNMDVDFNLDVLICVICIDV